MHCGTKCMVRRSRARAGDSTLTLYPSSLYLDHWKFCNSAVPNKRAKGGCTASFNTPTAPRTNSTLRNRALQQPEGPRHYLRHPLA